jgi:hypothetical protein
MEIEVGKRYRIDEEVVKSYSDPYYAIKIDNFYQAFPGMVVVVSGVQSNGRWVDTHSGYSLKVECLLPLLEEGMKVAVSTSCFGEDGNIDEDDYYETYPDGVGVAECIINVAGDEWRVSGKDDYWYISEKHLTPITDDVKTEAKDKEMTESKLEKDIRLLKEAEKKWVGVVYDGKVDGGPKDCPCCEEYFKDDCDGCPIGNNCKGVGYPEWWKGTIEDPFLRKVKDAKSEALARDVLTKIGDIRRELEHELEKEEAAKKAKAEQEKLEKEEQGSKVEDSLECYEYMVNGKPTGIKVGEYLQLEIGEVKSGNVISSSTLITLESPYSGSRQGRAGTPTGFISGGPDVLKKHFKMNDDGSIKVCVY